MKKILHIEGMHCCHCTAAVEKALKAVAGVHAVAVDLAGKQATVEAADNVQIDALKKAVIDAGFEVKSVARVPARGNLPVQTAGTAGEGSVRSPLRPGKRTSVIPGTGRECPIVSGPVASVQCYSRLWRWTSPISEYTSWAAVKSAA